jgi:hypothetical protein
LLDKWKGGGPQGLRRQSWRHLLDLPPFLGFVQARHSNLGPARVRRWRTASSVKVLIILLMCTSATVITYHATVAFDIVRYIWLLPISFLYLK